MRDISLKELLEAGCHFGHRVERWHPKAQKFIFQGREGIHIIDLVKTKEGLVAAAGFLRNLGQEEKSILFLGTKRQAKQAVSEAAKRAGANFLTSRWIGGFITNWDEVKKNIDKILKMRSDRADGVWQKFPKHEQVKLEKALRKLESVYIGVLELTGAPDALIIVDIRREDAALREALRRGIQIVAIVDTNADGSQVDYPVPANDDAIGSIECIINYLAEAYHEGREKAKKNAEAANSKQPAVSSKQVEEKEGETAENKRASTPSSNQEEKKEKTPAKKPEEKPAKETKTKKITKKKKTTE